MKKIILFMGGITLLGMELGLSGCMTPERWSRLEAYSQEQTYKESLCNAAEERRRSTEEQQEKAIVSSESALKNMEGSRVKGNKILFYGYSPEYVLPCGNLEIFTINKDGSELRNLTNTPDRLEYHSGWTNDGRIVYKEWVVITDPYAFKREGHDLQRRYCTLRNGYYHMKDKCYVMDEDGGNKTEISESLYGSLYQMN